MNYSRRFESALIYAAQLHSDHYRKGTETPYVTHLMAVASLVAVAQVPYFVWVSIATVLQLSITWMNRGT